MTEPIDSTPKKENKVASQSKQDMIFFALNYFCSVLWSENGT